MNKQNIAFLIVVIIGVLIFAFRTTIADLLESRNTFVITDIEMEDMLGYKTKIQDGLSGYVVFYTDMEGCSSCLAQVGMLSEVAKHFDEVGFFAVLKERTNRQRFSQLMVDQEFPGDSYLDSKLLIESRLGLGKNPVLIFFNRDKKIMAILPLDVAPPKLKRLLFTYLEEL